MALQKMEVPISLTEGVDTKTDKFLAAKLEVMENCELKKKGTPSKRRGRRVLSTDILGGGNIDSVHRVFTYESEKLLVSKGELFSYSESIQKWISKGPAPAFFVENIARLDRADVGIFTGGTLGGICYAENNGLAIYGNRGATNGSIYVLDQNEKTTILKTPAGDNKGGTQAFAIGSTVGCVDFHSNLLKLHIYNRTTNVIDTLLVSPFISATFRFHDAIAFVGGFVAIVYQEVDTTFLKIKIYDEDGIIQGSYDHTEGGTVWGIDFDGTELFILYTVGSDLKFFVRDVNLGAVHPITDTLQNSILHAGVVKNGTKWHIVAQDVFLINPQTKLIIIDAATAAIDSNTLIHRGDATGATQGYFLTYSPVVYNNKTYFFGNHIGAEQSLSFIFNDTGDIVGTFGANGITNLQSTYPLSRPHIDGSKFRIAFGTKGSGSRDYTYTSERFDTFYDIKELDADSDIDGLDTDAGESILYSSSYIMNYDGKRSTELGWLLFPENFQLVSQLAAAGFVQAGTYFYKMIFEYTDATGQIHRSAPSEQVEVVVAANDSSVTLFFNNLYHTNKEDFQYTGVLYRTLDTQSEPFYKIKSVPMGRFIDSGYNFIDTLDDITINSGETLYTTGGILENIAPSPSAGMRFHNERIFSIDAENRKQVPYSKKFFPESPMDFNDAFRLLVEDNQGRKAEDLFAVGTLDSKLILFKKSSILAVFGEGPDNLGLGDDLTLPELVTTDVGCINPRSVVITPDGLFFKSQKGIYLLRRNLQVEYIGADVEVYNDEVITSAILMEDLNQVRFTTKTGPTLVFDYYYKHWAWYENSEAQSAALAGSDMIIGKADGTVYVEDASFTDDAAFITQKIRTNWMKLNGIQGFQRVWRLLILGKYKSPHKLKLKIAYDYQDFDFDEYTLTPILPNSDYNRVNKPTSAELYAGVNDGVYQFEVHLKRQKCQAIKITLEDEQDGVAGESYELTNLTFVTGVKKGVNKLPSVKQS